MSNIQTNWIEEAISKKHIEHYDYKHFSNIQLICIGGLGKVYRAKWKDSEQYLALKSFTNDEIIVKELIREVKFI